MIHGLRGSLLTCTCNAHPSACHVSVSICACAVSCFVFRVSGFGRRVSGFGVRVPARWKPQLGLWALRFRVSGFGVRGEGRGAREYEIKTACSARARGATRGKEEGSDRGGGDSCEDPQGVAQRAFGGAESLYLSTPWGAHTRSMEAKKSKKDATDPNHTSQAHASLYAASFRVQSASHRNSVSQSISRGVRATCAKVSPSKV